MVSGMEAPSSIEEILLFYCYRVGKVKSALPRVVSDVYEP